MVSKLMFERSGGEMGAYVKIEVVHSQSFKCLFEAFLNVWMVGVPQLARYEDLFARDSTVLDALSHLVFVAFEYEHAYRLLEISPNLSIAYRRFCGDCQILDLEHIKLDVLTVLHRCGDIHL